MDVQTWYLKTSKLAVALAIIHSKPAGRSSREYTEYLASLLSQQESTWKSKVQALEAEVLRLRQKLFLRRMCSGLHKNAQDPTSSENTLTVTNDSGCDLSNEQRSEPSELSQCLVDSFSPPAVLPLPLRKKECTTVEHPLSSHMQFLQHLFELKKLTESGCLQADLKDSSIVSDSVSQLLDGLIAFYRHPTLPFSRFWTEAVGTLARLNSDFSSSNDIFKKCSKKLEEFEKTLLQAMLENDDINRFQVQHYVSQSLVTLGSCSSLRKPTISLLLSEVNSFTDYLGAIVQVQESYDVTRYENMFSLFWVLEQLLKEAGGDLTSPVDHRDPEIEKFLQKHDENIFRLSDTFPLFTFYLWRLGILLNSEKIETGE